MSGPSSAEVSIFGFRVKIAFIALCCLVAQTTAAVVLTRYSKMILDTPLANGQRREAYSNASLVVSTELVKFLASLALIFLFDTEDKLRSDAKASREDAPLIADAAKISSPAAPVPFENANTSSSNNAAQCTVPMDSVTSEGITSASAMIVNNNNTISTVEERKTSSAVGPAPLPPSPSAAAPTEAEALGVEGDIPPLLSFHGFSLRLGIWKDILYRENFKDIGGTLKLAVPALLYTVQNNVIYTALNNLEATTFQVGYQSKVVTTAVLSVLMLNRSLTGLKWLALLILTAGIILTQLQPATDGSKAEKPPAAAGEATSSSSSSSGGSSNSNNQFVGMVAVMTASCCSAFAGVYFEKILKGTAPSVWVRNGQLAFFSMFIGLVGYVGSLDPDEPFRFMDFFRGYSFLVCVIIAVQALGGLIIACVVKYADNILKGFATAMSIVLCGILSALFMGFFPNVMFIVGSSVVILATLLYSKPDKK